MRGLTAHRWSRYDLAVNWNGPKATGEEFVTGIIEPTVSDRTITSLQDHAGDWLCAWCLNRVANEKDRFQYGGKDEFAFTNPAGLRFKIITFTQTLGCRRAGKPTLEHTWFAGYAWSFCHCDQCGQHLGWCYTGQQEFVGLIKNRIVRALHIRN